MVICLSARRVWTHGLGGMEEHCRNLTSELVRQWHTLHVLTTAHPFPRILAHRARELRTAASL